MKKCTRCKTEKALTQFSKWSHGKDGYSDWCKECKKVHQREWRSRNVEKSRGYNRKYQRLHPERTSAAKRKFKYGITPEQFQQKLIEQHSSCAICGGNNKGRPLSVDHNHKTGQVRGLLCHACNYGIGALHEDRARFLKAMEYLDYWNKKNKTEE